MKTTFLFLSLLLVTFITSAQETGAPSQKKLALVIGNGNYIHSILANPENDARSMKSVLEKLGFDVLKYENLSQSQMKKAIDDFGLRLKEYEVGLFFYAGHGIQAKGYNYLIPVDAELNTEAQVEYDCVQADRVLSLMEESGATVKIVILDACRNNPFERSWSRSASGKGLATMNAPGGTLIAYSTAPGTTASDGSGNNSLYTTAMLEVITRPNVPILQMFQNVRAIVSQKSSKAQIPWESTSLTGDFYFNPDSNLSQTESIQSNILPVETNNQTRDNVIPNNTNEVPSSRDIKILEIAEKTSLSSNVKTYYVTLNKGLNSKIKPDNYLKLYSPTYVKSNITGENVMSETKRVGHIVVLNSFAEKSEGVLSFDEGINLGDEFNQNLSYARKKPFWNTVYIIPRIGLWSKELLFELENYQAKYGLSAGYSFHNAWGGGYAELGFISVEEVDYVGSYKYIEKGMFVSAGLIKMVGEKTGLRLGGSGYLSYPDAYVDAGVVYILNNGFTLINTLSFGIGPNNEGVNLCNLLYSFGVGFTF